MFPATGPAVVLLPTASLIVRLSVEALLSSLPAGTLVDNEKPAGEPASSPDPPSAAVQAIETLPTCHAPSAVAQFTLGAFLSTLFPEIGPAVAQFPTASQT